MFHGWENFFIVGASAGATLIGLLFVAITLGTGLSTPQGLNATSAFLTPTLILFGGVLLECMAVLPPWPSAWPVGIILGLCGLTGLVLQIHVILRQRELNIASLDWLDWAWFSAVPALGYASLIAGAAGLIAEKSFAPFATRALSRSCCLPASTAHGPSRCGSPETATRYSDADALCEFALIGGMTRTCRCHLARPACRPTCDVCGRDLQRQPYVDTSRLASANCGHSLTALREGQSTLNGRLAPGWG